MCACVGYIYIYILIFFIYARLFPQAGGALFATCTGFLTLGLRAVGLSQLYPDPREDPKK